MRIILCDSCAYLHNIFDALGYYANNHALASFPLSPYRHCKHHREWKWKMSENIKQSMAI